MLCMMLGAGNVWAADVTEDVTLSNGTFSTDHITWTLGGITIQQTKGSSSTAVSSSYVSAPRVYKGHILSFTAASGYMIKSISITYSNSYFGNSMTAGTELSGSTVTDNTTEVARTWATTSGGTHVVSAVNSSGLSTIYIQNVASGSNVQLRFTQLTITYEKTTSAESATASFADSAPSVMVGSTYTNTLTTTPSSLAVSYSSSDEDVATVNASTGLVTGISAGSVLITATWAAQTIGGTSYLAGSANYQLVVVGAIEDGVFDFSLNQDYGSGYEHSSVKVQEGTWTAGSVTMLTAGRNCWFTDGTTFRLYAASGDNAAGSMTFSVPAGQIIASIEFTAKEIALTADRGELSDKTWTGAAQTVVFTSTATTNVSKIVVTLGTAPDVATPVSSVLTGTYSTAQTVTLTCDTESADIYYTTDGSEPSATSGTKYTTPINVAATTTIKAVAVKGGVASTVLSLTITIPTTTYTSIAALKTAAPTEPVILQLTNAQVYYKNGSTDLYVGDASGALDFYKAGLNYSAGTVLNGSLVVTGYTVYKSLPEITGVADNQLTATEGTLAPAVVTADDVTLADYECQLVQVRGTYTVDGSNTYVDDLAIYNKFGKTLPEELADGVEIVVTGIVVPFNDAPELLITALTIPDGTVPSAPTLSLVGQTIDPAEVYFVNAQSVAANVAAGTVVYYTTDGSVPTTASTVYSEPITIDKTTTVKAIAVKDGETSEVATLTVNIYGGGSGLNGDVDGNGSITIADVTKLVNIILGKE